VELLCRSMVLLLLKVCLFFPALFLLFFLLSFSSIFSVFLLISLPNPPLFRFLYFFVLPSTPPCSVGFPPSLSLSLSFFLLLFPLLSLLSLGFFFFIYIYIYVPLCFPSHNITMSFLSSYLFPLFLFFLILPLFVPPSFLSFSLLFIGGQGIERSYPASVPSWRQGRVAEAPLCSRLSPPQGSSIHPSS